LSQLEKICAEHEWNVPERYNIAADVCDRHPADKLAMIFEDFRGNRREVLWGEQQNLANQAANMLTELGIVKGDRVAVCAPASPETAAIFFGAWKVGAILIAMSVLYGDEGIEHRVRDSGARLIVSSPDHVERMPADLVDEVISFEPGLLDGYSDDFETLDTSAEDPAQIYYTSGTTGQAKGILHAHRYILAHEEFIYCHEVEDGEIFHGMGEWAWAAGICPLLGPWRLGAVQFVYQREGGFDPEKQLDAMSRNRVTNVFTTPTAVRAMMAVEDAGERYPQVIRRACSAGEPLNPEAIRWFRSQYGITILDFYGLTESYPLCGNFPWQEVREGSMGLPMPGWEVAILDPDEKPVADGERGEICLKARTNPHYPLRYWENEEATAADFDGEWFHTKDAAHRDEDGYFWYAGRADDVIISAGYRIGPFEVESACIEHPAVHEAAAVAAADEAKGSVVKAFLVLNQGYEPSDELAKEVKASVRKSLSAYAYPRQIEFIDELPKTLTGKIRRIELRD